MLPSAPLEIPAGFIWKTGVCGLASDGTLVFDSELKQGDKIRIYLEVKCPPKSHGISLVTNAGAPLESFKLYNWNRFISFEGAGGENGRVTISLLARGRFGDGVHRPIFTGLTSMAHCDGSDPLARVDVLEKVTLYSQIESRAQTTPRWGPAGSCIARAARSGKQGSESEHKNLEVKHKEVKADDLYFIVDYDPRCAPLNLTTHGSRWLMDASLQGGGRNYHVNSD